MKKIICTILLLIQISGRVAGQSYTVSGYVTDKDTRETLIGVTVIIKETNQGVASDNNGFFQIMNLKNGNYTFIFSYVGYVKLEKLVHVQDKSIILTETSMQPSLVNLQESRGGYESSQEPITMLGLASLRNMVLLSALVSFVLGQ